MTSRWFRSTAAHFASGVTVVTSIADDVPVGTTVNAFTTVSLDPALLLVSLRRGSRLLASVEESGVFAVTILGADQRRHASWFASPTRPTGVAAFAGIATRPAPRTGAPLLAEGVAYFDCRVHEVYPGGDHAIVLGEVVGCGELVPREPLMFLGRDFVTLGTTAPHCPAPALASSALTSSSVLASSVASVGSGWSITASAAGVTTRR